MNCFAPYRSTFEHGASRFVKWSLTPTLLLFLVFFGFQTAECIREERTSGAVVCVVLGIGCLAGVLGLWGIPYAGRVVTGIVALLFGGYLIEECFVSFDGSWGFGASTSATTPINSILGFLVFGVPCLLYTILGRFSLRVPTGEPMQESDSDVAQEDAEEVEPIADGNRPQAPQLPDKH